MPRALPLGYQPNILVINTDDAPLNWYEGMPLWQANWASLFVDFQQNGSCNVPLCLPGRAATLTGKRVERHRGWDNSSGENLDLSSTFLVALQRAGYFTGAIGKWVNGFGESGGGGFGDPVRQPGLDFQRIQWGAPNYLDWVELDENGDNTTSSRVNMVTNRIHADTDGRAAYTDSDFTDYCTDIEGDRVLEFLAAAAATGRPWCLYWAPKAPHKDSGSGPLPPTRHASTTVDLNQSASFGLDPAQYGCPQWLINSAETPWDAAAEAALRAEHRLSLRTILGYDENLHRVMLALQSAGLLDTTAIMSKTDNAHAYGEMRQADKGTPLRSASSMLLQVYVPGVSGGTRDQAVSDIDIAPTVCHLAGATLPHAPDGMSMVRAIQSGAAAHRLAAPIGSPIKDSPTFRGLWDRTGRVTYEGLPGGKAAGQGGGWIDFDMTTHQPLLPIHAERIDALFVPTPEA